MNSLNKLNLISFQADLSRIEHTSSVGILSPGTNQETLNSTKIYGNKYKELSKLSDLLDKNPIEGVKIPVLKGISHDTTKDFLSKKDPAIFILWKELQFLHLNSENSASFF